MTKAWPADTAPERRPLANLIPYAKNARLHSDAQVDQIAASMREFGAVWPALIDTKNEIIAGHGRILAAEKNGWADYPVIVARGWTKRQIKAYRLADNQLALNAAWDVKLLAAELGELTDVAALIGFSDNELKNIFLDRADGETDPDAEWQGMPAFAQDDTTGLKAIVHFENEADKESFEQLLGQKIPSNTKAIWYPAKRWENMRGQQWTA